MYTISQIQPQNIILSEKNYHDVVFIISDLKQLNFIALQNLYTDTWELVLDCDTLLSLMDTHSLLHDA